MKRVTGLVVVLLAACAPASDLAFLDSHLQRTIDAYGLRPLPTKPFEVDAKFELGQALFFDPILSGNRDVSCATCHIIDRGLSDSLPASIGTTGVGLAEARTLPAGRPVQIRNALDLWNRDNNSVTAMFWDGRVAVGQPNSGSFRTPLGDALPEGLENLLAAQALFPLTQANEMLGLPGDISPGNLPPPHAARANELAIEPASLEEPQRTLRALELLVERLLGRGSLVTERWQSDYRDLVAAAYPDTPIEEMSIVEIANALSHFQEIAFATRDTPWDRYLAGDVSVLTATQKRGALLFYGRGGCAVCHSGPLLSDFAFHSVGVLESQPDGDRDPGRYDATSNLTDRFQFRTPPLRNVTLSAPYFHNGSATSLRDAIVQHLDPYIFADKYGDGGEYMMAIEEIEAISPLLQIHHPLGEGELDALLAFLAALEDSGPVDARAIRPRKVPSGLSLPSQPTAP